MSAEIQIEIVDANSDRVIRDRITCAHNACVRDALAASSLPSAYDALARMSSVNHVADSCVGVWGRRVLLDTPLSVGDRVELYRELITDAKIARSKRASEQGYRWQGRTRRAVKSNSN
jgi:putative ubiquitin-RnfH superfamily antitoxin RatB of RatAB toxin-antitoxin module